MTSRPWLSAPRKKFECHVGPIGVSPSFSGPPPCWSTSILLPSTTVVPLRLFANGAACATCFAYSGAAKVTTTIRTNSTSAASATRLRMNRRPARRQGLFPAISRAVSPGARTTAPAGSGSYANSAIPAAASLARPHFTDAWARRKYHCGLNWKPFTRDEVKSSIFVLTSATHGALSVVALSTPCHCWFAASVSSSAVALALSICASMPLSQNCAMFGLEFEFGWNDPQPSRMSRKSDAAGESANQCDHASWTLFFEFCAYGYWMSDDRNCGVAL